MQKSTLRQFAVCIGAAVIALSSAVAGAEDRMASFKAMMCVDTDEDGVGAKVTNGIRCEVPGIGNTWMSTSFEDVMKKGWQVGGMSTYQRGSTYVTQFLMVRSETAAAAQQ